MTTPDQEIVCSDDAMFKFPSEAPVFILGDWMWKCFLVEGMGPVGKMKWLRLRFSSGDETIVHRDLVIPVTQAAREMWAVCTSGKKR